MGCRNEPAAAEIEHAECGRLLPAAVRGADHRLVSVQGLPDEGCTRVDHRVLHARLAAGVHGRSPASAGGEWNPAWHGHSIGRWEGDTLVIDTVGFNELVAGFGVHSEKLHVIERWRRPNLGRLEVEITATDSEAWTGEYKFSIAASLIPNQEVLEFICAENNQDVNHWITDRAWRGRP